MPTPTNPYYQRVFDAIAGSLARAKSLVTEFALVQIGFDRIKLRLDQMPSLSKYQCAASDLDTALSATDPAVVFRMQSAATLTEVRAAVLTASTSGAITIDIKVGGTSIFDGTNYLTIDQGDKTSVGSAAPYVLATGAEDLADDDEVKIIIVGGGTGAIGLTVSLLVEPTI